MLRIKRKVLSPVGITHGLPYGIVRRLHRADEWWRRHVYQHACERVDLSADVQLGLHRIWYKFMQ